MLIDSKGGGWGFELGRGRGVGILPLLKYYWPFLENSVSAVAEAHLDFYGQFRVHKIF